MGPSSPGTVLAMAGLFVCGLMLIVSATIVLCHVRCGGNNEMEREVWERGVGREKEWGKEARWNSLNRGTLLTLIKAEFFKLFPQTGSGVAGFY